MSNKESGKLHPRHQLLMALADGRRYIYPNTTSKKKAAGLQEILDLIIGQDNVSVHMLAAIAGEYEETDLPSSSEVSIQKAAHFKDSQKKLGYESVTAGADTVFKIRLNDGGWVNWSKLERLGRDLTAQEILKQYENLFEVLCTPVNGKGEMLWDVSLTIINGEVDTFSQRIYIEYSPIDKELLKIYFQDAIAEGFIYKYNSRIAMIEMLIASNSVKKMAFLEKDGSLKRMIREPNKVLLQLAASDIISTMPLAFLNGLATDEPNWRGWKAE